MPRIPYVDPASVSDPEIQGYLELARREGTPRPESQAIRDPLTSLFNRRYIEAMLPGELSRAQRYEVPLSVLVLDVDFFKKINDRFGHAGLGGAGR